MEGATQVSSVKPVVTALRARGVRTVAWIGRPFDRLTPPPAPDETYAATVRAGGPDPVWETCPVAANFYAGLDRLGPARRHRLLVEGVPQILGSCGTALNAARVLSALHARLAAGAPVVVRVAPLRDGVKLPDTMQWTHAAPRVVRAGGIR